MEIADTDHGKSCVIVIVRILFAQLLNTLRLLGWWIAEFNQTVVKHTIFISAFGLKCNISFVDDKAHISDIPEQRVKIYWFEVMKIVVIFKLKNFNLMFLSIQSGNVLWVSVAFSNLTLISSLWSIFSLFVSIFWCQIFWTTVISPSKIDVHVLMSTNSQGVPGWVNSFCFTYYWISWLKIYKMQCW